MSTIANSLPVSNGVDGALSIWSSRGLPGCIFLPTHVIGEKLGSWQHRMGLCFTWLWQLSKFQITLLFINSVGNVHGKWDILCRSAYEPTEEARSTWQVKTDLRRQPKWGGLRSTPTKCFPVVCESVDVCVCVCSTFSKEFIYCFVEPPQERVWSQALSKFSIWTKTIVGGFGTLLPGPSPHAQTWGSYSFTTCGVPLKLSSAVVVVSTSHTKHWQLLWVSTAFSTHSPGVLAVIKLTFHMSVLFWH